MSDYTPPTGDVELGYVERAETVCGTPHFAAGLEFDRWLASMKAEAWDEGAKWAAVECEAITTEGAAWIAPGDNPYRLDYS